MLSRAAEKRKHTSKLDLIYKEKSNLASRLVNPSKKNVQLAKKKVSVIVNPPNNMKLM
jgi:hypothetical protein